MKTCDQWLVEAFQAQRMDLPELAVSAFEQALNLDPDDASIRQELARAYCQAAQRAEAIEMLDSITDVSDADAEFVMEQGKLWVLAGQPDRALSEFLSIASSGMGGEASVRAQALLEAVILLCRSARCDEATTLLKSAGKRQTSTHRTVKSCISLAEAIIAEQQDDIHKAIRILGKLWNNQPQSGLDLETGYRYARLLLRTGNAPRSMEVLFSCKSVERKLYSGKSLEQKTRERQLHDISLLENLEPDWFSDRKPLAHAKSTLLLGHPRSGTSLMARRLSSLNDIDWVDEPPVFDVLAQSWISNLTKQTPSISLHQALGSLSDKQAARFQSHYLSRLKSCLSDKNNPSSHCLDKNPGLSSSWAALHKLLPESAWLVALRDPRDVAVSCYFQRFGDTSLGWQCLTPEGAINAVQHVMQLWTLVRRKLPANAFLEIRYEDFVANEQSECARISSAMPWQANKPSCASSPNKNGTAGVNLTPSYAAIEQPTYHRAIGVWPSLREHFSNESPLWSQLIEELGYES